MKYRFKTRQEFENQYGPKWGEIIKGGWHDDMTHLFGTVIPDGIDCDAIFSGASVYGQIKDSGLWKGFWTISKDMIVPIAEDAETSRIFPMGIRLDTCELSAALRRLMEPISHKSKSRIKKRNYNTQF